MPDTLLQGMVVQRPPNIAAMRKNPLRRGIYDKSLPANEPVDIHIQRILRNLFQPIGIMLPDTHENGILGPQLLTYLVQ